MTRRSTRWALVAVPLALSACKKEEPAAVVRPVLTTVVALQTSRVLGFAGTVEPQYHASLGFQVMGRIITRDVKVGDLVVKAQQLAALDPTVLEFAMRSAQADLSNAQAQLGNATATEARQRILFEQNTTSSAQYELVQQAREAAAAAVTRARANLAKAEKQLGYAQLRAEFDGVVVAVDAEVGQVVSPGQTVITVARPDVREAVVDVSEDVNGSLQPGALFDLALQIDSGIKTTGRVREIAPQADSSTGTRRVRITLDNPPGMFRLGTTVTATLTAKIAPQIELPVSALMEKDGKSMVWVVDPATNKVALRDVRIAGRTDRAVRIADGLAPGTQVVIAGVNSLVPGQLVKISERAVR